MEVCVIKVNNHLGFEMIGSIRDLKVRNLFIKVLAIETVKL